MTQRSQTLTEKEKQSLRLLMHGHDAKSMARHLGLSVHTINERLRDARRKMQVSSSRQAARQLRDIEASDPEFLGSKPLGDDATTRSGKNAQTPAEATSMVRRFGWIFGGIFMSLSLAMLALSSLSGTAQAPSTPQSATPSTLTAETPVVLLARKWLALVDAGDWNGSWNETGQAFKALNTSDRWADVSRSARAPLGAVVSRKVMSEENVPAPPYGYQVVKFRTSYANKVDAVETLSLVRENNSWRVVGYTIE